MKYEILAGQTVYKTEVESVGGRLYRVSLIGRDHRVDFFEVAENLYSMICDDRSYEADVTETGDVYIVSVKGTSYSVQVLQPGERPPIAAQEQSPAREGMETVVSPMTCTVVRIAVKPGEIVERDSELLVTEAMKLEMPIPSPVRGRVEEVLVSEGQTVDRGMKLVTLVPVE